MGIVGTAHRPLRVLLAMLLALAGLTASCGDDSSGGSGGDSTTNGSGDAAASERDEIAQDLGFGTWTAAEGAASLYCLALRDVADRSAFEAQIQALRETRDEGADRFGSLAEEMSVAEGLAEQFCPDVHAVITG